MKTKNISFSFKEYDDPGQLEKDDRELVKAAKDAAKNAYSPYSGFSVGAAVRLSGGSVVMGANVENAAFPSGLCAERSALSNCISNHSGDAPVAIAVVAVTGGELTADPVSPCGQCRQVLAEEEMRNGNPIRVILSGSNKTQVIESCSFLLPLQFSRNSF